MDTPHTTSLTDDDNLWQAKAARTLDQAVISGDFSQRCCPVPGSRVSPGWGGFAGERRAIRSIVRSWRRASDRAGSVS